MKNTLHDLVSRLGVKITRLLAPWLASWNKMMTSTVSLADTLLFRTTAFDLNTNIEMERKNCKYLYPQWRIMSRLREDWNLLLTVSNSQSKIQHLKMQRILIKSIETKFFERPLSFDTMTLKTTALMLATFLLLQRNGAKFLVMLEISIGLSSIMFALLPVTQ